MTPFLVTLALPTHNLEAIGRYVVRNDLASRLMRWKTETGAHELFYMATCQRALWVLWGGEPERMRIDSPMCLEGPEAWKHLVSVAAGLSSCNPGDPEIPGQMHRALEESLAAGSAKEECQAAFEEVLREGLRLRNRLGLDQGSTSVASIALKLLERRLPLGSEVALVGVGDMTRYLAERLSARGFRMRIVNRTLEQAKRLADPLGIPVEPLDAFRRDPGPVQALVTATGAPEPLFTFLGWKEVRRVERLLLIDLALPSDAAPDLDGLGWVERVPLEACLEEAARNRARRAALAESAEPLLAEAVARLVSRARHREARRARARVDQEVHAAWERVLEEAESGPLEGLSEAQRLALFQLLHKGKSLTFQAMAHMTNHGFSREEADA